MWVGGCGYIAKRVLWYSVVITTDVKSQKLKKWFLPQNYIQPCQCYPSVSLKTAVSIT